MRALLVKNHILLWTLCLIGLSILTAFVFDRGFDAAFALPPERFFDELVYALPILGVLLGLLLGGLDALRGTEDYLYHRPLSKGQIFWRQAALGGVVALLWIVVPIALLALFGRQGLEPDYLGLGISKVLVMSMVFPAYALGLFLAYLPLHWIVRLVLLVPLGYWLVGDNLDNGVQLAFASGAGWYFVRCATFTATFLMGAYFGLLAGNDPDRPHKKTAWLPFGILLFALAWSIPAILREYTDELLTSNRGVTFAQLPDQSIALVAYEFDSNTRRMNTRLVDPGTHKRLEIIEGGKGLRHIPDTQRAWYRESGRDSISGGSRTWDEAFWMGYLGMSQGSVTIYSTHDGGTGLRSQSGRQGSFSELARFPSRNRQSSWSNIFVGDPADGTLWSLPTARIGETFEVMEIPGGAKFEQWVEPDREYAAKLEEYLNPRVDGSAQADPERNGLLYTLLKTNTGFAWLHVEDRKVLPLPEAALAWITQLEMDLRGRGPQVVMTDPSLLKPTYEVRDPSGKVLFEHRMAPRTTAERARAVNARVASLWYSPILMPLAIGNVGEAVRISRYESEASGASPGAKLSSALLNGARILSPQYERFAWRGLSIWSLWSLLVLGFFVWWLRRYLRIIGATGKRLWLWPLAVLLFGLPAVLVARFVETKRRHRGMPVLSEVDAPRPWIRAAG